MTLPEILAYGIAGTLVGIAIAGVLFQRVNRLDPTRLDRLCDRREREGVPTWRTRN